METKRYEDILDEYGKLIYTNVGVSMMPLLRQNRDLMIIERRPYEENGSPAPLRKFDAVLYKRNDKYILHRIIKVNEPEGNMPRSYDIVGDNQWQIEKGVSEDRILGVLTGVVRDGVETDFTDIKSRAYRFIWCDCLQLRRAVLRGRDVYYHLGHELAAKTRIGAKLKRIVRGNKRK